MPSTSKLLIIDSLTDGELDLFNPESVKLIHHTLLPWSYLAKKAKEDGMDVLTARDFLLNSEPYKDHKKYLVSQLITERTEKLIRENVTPLLLTCQESPFIATKFYLSLKSNSSNFIHTMIFSGARKRLSEKTKYLEMHFPVSPSLPSTLLSFSERKKLVTIVAYKTYKTTLKEMILKFLYGPVIKSLADYRLKTIADLAKNKNIDVFGEGWEKSPYYDPRIFGGKIDEKTEIMSRYRFCLCFENTVFPGYVTEKIFDCFFGKTIPIYLGAPDIEKYVPKNSFIDMRDFKNTGELVDYLNDMDEKTFNDYLKNAEIFLTSENYKNFDQTIFASRVIDFIKANV